MGNPQVVKSVAWSAVERFSTIGIQFILNIIIARILSPSDYGIIGMLVFLYVFITSIINVSNKRKLNSFFIMMYVLIICSTVEISFNYFFFITLFMIRTFKNDNLNNNSLEKY